MNYLLETNNYLHLPGVLSSARALALAQGLDVFHQAHPVPSDDQVPGAPCAYDYLPFIRLLVEKIPMVESCCGEQVLPTYAYGRIYGKGQALAPHLDRDACELSVTLNLDCDQVWPISIAKPGGEVACLALEPGDAMMYLGCVASHWRDPFPGERCTQVFLHYVFSYGSRAHAYFDKR